MLLYSINFFTNAYNVLIIAIFILCKFRKQVDGKKISDLTWTIATETYRRKVAVGQLRLGLRRLNNKRSSST